MVNNYTLITLFKYKTTILHNVNETIQGEICQLKSIGLTIENLIGSYSKVSSLKYLKLASFVKRSCQASLTEPAAYKSTLSLKWL
jgi:hypothetical protein